MSKPPTCASTWSCARAGRSLSVDLGGGPLHRRGWRLMQGEAPLKENLAAAVLMRGDWPAVYAEGGALLDPMCGSGTLVIEAALMAADVAPGLQRAGGLRPTGWRGFDDGWLEAAPRGSAATRVARTCPAAAGVQRQRHRSACDPRRARERGGGRRGRCDRVGRRRCAERRAGVVRAARTGRLQSALRRPPRRRSRAVSRARRRDSSAWYRTGAPACCAATPILPTPPGCARRRSTSCSMARSSAR